MKVKFPYGRTELEYDFPEQRVKGILRGRLEEYKPQKSQQQLVLDAMQNPIASAPLKELAKGKNKIVLIASDHTRPVPSRLIVPQMLREIREGNPQAEVTILIATGCHRATQKEELLEKFGPEILENEHIVIHDCEDEESLVEIGTLPSGGRLKINRLAWEADLLVAEGFIEPHFFAGFSGGRKSILPGIASRECVHYNHNSEFMDDPYSRTGELQKNPIHTDMLYAAKTAKLAYIVNVVINARKEVVACFAGDCEKAHLAGADFVLEQTGCKAEMADVVVTTNNGYPLDQNIYQMVKCMASAEMTCREGGAIIAAGQCDDGVGGDSFLEMFRQCASVSDLLSKFRQTPPEKTERDQWQAHILARILEKHPVILISGADDETVRMLHMHPAHSLEEALKLADTLTGKPNGEITLIPEGISVVVRS